MSDSEFEATIPEAKPIDPFVCPRGHHAVKLNATRFSCKTCRRQQRETVTWDKTELVDLREEDPPLAADDEDEGVSEVFPGP